MNFCGKEIEGENYKVRKFKQNVTRKKSFFPPLDSIPSIKNSIGLMTLPFIYECKWQRTALNYTCNLK